ncbi:hypothetical protein [Chryseosolibacter indicus]|uniref:Histidine kinase n=1 Tax=Chryseosolibacter indicus TaxID=2782351 RepID=A0ABS5VSV5_9BACT|nr:hypothetical protein [Chryseosolibacter indicus]MBT1704492.1 hypothetical protein [Chryseosolibacter indicus]
MINLFTVIQIFELLTAIIASIHYKKYSGTFLKYFLYMLWLVVIIEAFIWLFMINGVIVQNNFIYNIFTSLQYVFYYVLFYNTLVNDTYKKWIRAFIILFILLVIINFVWIQKLTVTVTFHSYTFTVGAILLIITIGLFFIEILNNEKVLYFTRYLMFWISIGLLVFYTGIIPYIISLNLLPEMLSNDSLTIIFIVLNVVMYSCFIFGFVFSKKYY